MGTANRLTVSLCAAVFPFARSGCRLSYKQPGASDCAGIRVISDMACISKVDGLGTLPVAARTMQGVLFLGGADLPMGERQVDVTPGKHTIQIQSLDLVADLWLVAEPNAQYIVKVGKPTDYGQSVWIEEIGTGQVVAGTRPSEAGGTNTSISPITR